jgi:hypothetical protein
MKIIQSSTGIIIESLAMERISIFEVVQILSVSSTHAFFPRHKTPEKIKGPQMQCYVHLARALYRTNKRENFLGLPFWSQPF